MIFVVTEAYTECKDMACFVVLSSVMRYAVGGRKDRDCPDQVAPASESQAQRAGAGR